METITDPEVLASFIESNKKRQARLEHEEMLYSLIDYSEIEEIIEMLEKKEDNTFEDEFDNILDQITNNFE